METLHTEKEDKFIGWTSPDGKLKVIGFERMQLKNKLYRVECSVCKEDKEMHPLGYFLSSSQNLQSGQIPCGCSKYAKFNKEQWLIKVKRSAKPSIIVNGFVDEFKTGRSRVNCTCSVCGHKWTPTLINITSKQRGCKKCGRVSCGDKQRKSVEQVIEDCKRTCEGTIYKFIGLKNGYKNTRSLILYECPHHGVIEQSYESFVLRGSRCGKCANNVAHDEEYANFVCEEACYKEGHSPLGFDVGYKNNRSKFYFVCDKHGKQRTDFNTIVVKRARCVCKECNKLKSKTWGFYKGKENEEDYLYVMQMDGYIKVGRSFNIENRMKGLESVSGCSTIKLLMSFIGKHIDVFNLEHSILLKLKSLNLQHVVDWTEDTFKIDTLDLIYELCKSDVVTEVFHD